MAISSGLALMNSANATAPPHSCSTHSLPWRALLMPTGNVVFQCRLYGIRECTLRAAIEINLALEDVEAGTDVLYLVVASAWVSLSQ